jgi:exopolyphosphatase/guanosine-5'-triphosphate,3'-diphosphate pyrophosphatase
MAPGTSREAFGAIDLGSNNCRLLIAKPSGPDGFRVVEAFSRIVRLGEGVYSSGVLSEAAMDRSIKALAVCAEKLRRWRVKWVRAVATEACRRARNGQEFVERVAAETGIELDVISYKEEVRLAADGCAPLLNPRVPNALIFDIGGGSTEISWVKLDRSARPKGRNGVSLKLADWCSLPYGVVNISERYGGHEVSEADYEAIKAEIREAALQFELRSELQTQIRDSRLQLLGTSGTVTTLTGVHLALPQYQRALVDGYRLSFDTVRRICAKIAEMSYEERRAEGCIGAERADLVIAGCAVLEALCDIWPTGSLRVADRGLREGILMLLMREARANAHAGDS